MSSMDTFLATKAEMRRVARAQMKRGVRQNCHACHNSAHGGKLRSPDQGRFFPTGHGLFWVCCSCLTRMSVRDRKRMRDSLERRGLPYTSTLSVPVPPTREQLRRRRPKYCSECNNGLGGRVLLSSDQGQFLIDHRGERWVCHRCINQSNCAACTSPDEKQLHAWLVSEHISHRMQALIGGELFDCHITDWDLLIELGIRSAHPTAAQTKKDWQRNRIAKEHNTRLLCLQWDDRDSVAKIQAARKLDERPQQQPAFRSLSPWAPPHYYVQADREPEGIPSDTPPEDAPWQ